MTPQEEEVELKRVADVTAAATAQQILQHNRRYAKEYVDAASMAKTSETRRKQLREIILGLVASQGKVDEKGNKWLPAIDHVMKAERRESVSFDANKAEKWLRERGGWDEYSVRVEEVVIPAYQTLNEDALAAYIYANRFDPNVPDELPDEVYNRRETIAIKVTKEDQYDY
jgi:hypothetical protein